jgi:RNA polymerase sigma factor (TIGR02999 family)
MAEITQLLREWREGNREAEDQLFAQVGPDLRRLAHYMMKGERQGHTMQATELVDEIYLKLVAAKDRDWRSRAHFFAIAARAMRRHLIDYARARPKAGFVALDDVQAGLHVDTAKLDEAITLNRLLDELEQVHPEWCQVVDVKYFLGMTDEEAAGALGIKLRTLQRIWFEARSWLFEKMEAAL